MVNWFLLSASGVFFLIIAILDVEWFLRLMTNNSKRSLLGRNFQRVVLVILGLSLIFFALGAL